MGNIEKTKEILEKEYNENCTKIDELSEKIRIIEANDFEKKLTDVFIFSMIPWAAIIVLLSTIIKPGIVPINLILPLSTCVPTLIGITWEKLLTIKTKERLEVFSKSKSQKEKIEESTKYEIEREKLRNSNKVLKKACDILDMKQNLFSSLSNEYNILENDSSSTSEIELNVEKISEILNQKKKNIDTITTKNVLKEKFWRIRGRFQKVADFITISILGGAVFMIAYDIPIITINNLGYNIQIQTNILGMLSPFVIGGVVCGGYAVKRKNDHICAFRSVNKELGQEALSETVSNSELKRKKYNNYIEHFDIELENLIDDTCTVKLLLESERQKLDNNDLTRGKEPTTDKELALDKDFIDKQLENYNKIIELPIIQEVEKTKVVGPRLVKKMTSSNNKK